VEEHSSWPVCECPDHKERVPSVWPAEAVGRTIQACGNCLHRYPPLVLRALKPGDRFEEKGGEDNKRRGTVLRVSDTAARVQWDGAPLLNPKGEEYCTQPGEIQYVTAGLPIKPLYGTEEIRRNMGKGKKKPEPTPVPTSAPIPPEVMKLSSGAATAKGVTLAWAFLMGKLSKTDTDQREPIRERVMAVYAQATNVGIELIKPGFDDPIFQNLRLKPIGAPDSAPAPTEAPLPQPAIKPKIKAKGKLCQCGCGYAVSGRFAQGHDARWNGWMRRIAAGTMKREELPALLQEEVQWRKCKGCGSWCPTTTAMGQPETSGLCSVCRGAH